MYLGITLNRLDDFESACNAFNKSIELDNSDCIIYLNYAIVLFNNKEKQKATEMFQKSEEILKEQKLGEDGKVIYPEKNFSKFSFSFTYEQI